MPVAVFRRYTPPTCTLELRGARSPLSVWSDRPIVKQVQFILSIDGPQRPEEHRITLKGGRTQLDHLHGVINDYVQQTLGLSAQQFQSTLLQPFVSKQGPSSLSASTASVDSMGQALATPGRIHDIGWARTSSQTLSITPKGRLKHELHLGKLAPHPSSPSVVLSTTELFDLAHALDSYHGEVDSIPELNPVQRQGVHPWMKGAAVAVLAIGVTASVMNVLQLPTPNGSVETAMEESADRVDDSLVGRLDNSTDQQWTQPSDPNAATIELDDIPSATRALPSEEKNKPSEALSTDADPSELEQTPVKPASQSPQAEQAEKSTDNESELGAIARVPANRNQSLAEANRQDSAPTNPTNPPLPNQPSRPRSASAPNPTVVPSPLPAEIAAAGTRPTSPPGNPAQTETSAGALANNGNVEARGDIALLPPPELTSIPPIPTVESGLDPLADSASLNDQIGSNRRFSSPDASSEVQQSGQPGAASKDPQAHSNNAETQRTEVQAYFESGWQPPEALNQALQYRLEFNSDGSLQQAIPLGESARAYRPNVNLPVTGEPFVSPFGGNDTPPMRLVLGANGQVRVFIESLD